MTANPKSAEDLEVYVESFVREMKSREERVPSSLNNKHKFGCKVGLMGMPIVPAALSTPSNSLNHDFDLHDSQNDYPCTQYLSLPAVNCSRLQKKKKRNKVDRE